MVEIIIVVATSSLSHPALPVPHPAPFLTPICPLAPTDPAPRLRLGDYELLERVGRGGMAEVWMARRVVFPGGLKACALKIIHGRIAAQPRYRRMFLQEARLALKLRHANLVSVFDVGEAEGRLFMALEWVDGVHLRDFAQAVCDREGGLSVPLVCHLVSELLQGLRHAHSLRVGGRSLGVVHRDIAPHNVLVSAAGELKLADFGIARVQGELSSGMHIKGRARYMAPEQLHGEPTQGSDLFAVGAILHELLDGRRFRDDLERSSDWHRVVSEAQLPPLSRRDVPAPLEALRVGLLQPDPRRRIASADEALAWLLRCPPWRPGATALRGLYERCVGTVRRTGLTDPELVRAAVAPWAGVVSPPAAVAPWNGLIPPPAALPLALPSAATPAPSGPIALASSPPIAFATAPSGPVPAACHRPNPTATLRLRSHAPSWTPTPSPSHGTEPMGPDLHAVDAAVVHRRCGPPARRGRATRPARGLRWLGHGLWLLAGLLALTAVFLAFGLPPRRGPACIQEPPAPAPGRAWLRLRGDGQPHGQVRIDMQTLSVAARGECWVSPGVHELAWRGSPEEPWHHVGSHTLVSAKEHLVRVGHDGLAITAYDP
ncbi:serine/threonine-protein kinase [Paraliomyxa miuraensis]|uniref:serine/threonine-protein kinase n=1 Tax=Paraliomyxa miuraensis TaxID=376150 RepID=UPI0022515D13|nr:serine/threonine protein kinase [Paraliomyxa miuraensis]MCX4240353.1 protein kinase [Paraliomyxa miuraensis]